MAIFWLRYQGSRVALRQGETVVGRSPYCSFVINSRRVSRQHCALRVDGNKLYVTDLGSSNGTWLNGEPVTGDRLVQPGDLIELGEEGIEVLGADAPRPRDGQETQKDLPIYLRDYDDDAEQTTVTGTQTSSVALIESLVANGSSAASPVNHFGKVQRAVEKYLSGGHRIQSSNGKLEIERLRRSVEATAHLDGSSEAADWRSRVLSQLVSKPGSDQRQRQ